MRGLALRAVARNLRLEMKAKPRVKHGATRVLLADRFDIYVNMEHTALFHFSFTH